MRRSAIEHLAAAHELYENERYIEAGRELDAANAAGVVLSGDESRWARRCAGDAAAAAQLRDAVLGLSPRASHSWTLSTDAEQIVVLYRNEQDTPIHSIAAQFDVSAPIKVIMMLMAEADLLPSWMPSFLGLEVRRLAQPGRFRQLVYMKIWMPWPFKDREMVFDAMGCDLIEEHGGILVVVRSYDPTLDADLYGTCDVPQITCDRVRIDITLAGAFVHGGHGHDCTLANVVNADLKLPVVPTSLVNYLTRKLIWHALKAFRKKAASLSADLPAEYEERLRLNKDLVYDELDKRIAKLRHLVHTSGT